MEAPAGATNSRPLGAEHYTAREIRLLRRFAAWIKSARPDRIRAIEILLEDLTQASQEEPE